MAIGFLFELQVFLTYLFPWWPDLFAWRTGLTGETTSAQGCVCIAKGDPLGSILVHWGGYTKNLLPFAIYYLAPLAITFTVTIITLFTFIADQIAFAMGYYTGIFQMGGSCRISGSAGITTSYGCGPPFYWAFTSNIGGMLAIAVMIIFSSRKYLVETIRAARGDKSLAIEANEAFSYRTIYILLGASFVLVLAFLLSAGLSMGSAFMVLIVGGMTNTLAGTYILGLSGCAVMQERATGASAWPLHVIWPTSPNTYSTDWLMSNFFIQSGANHMTHGLQTGAYVTIQGLSLGSMTKVGARSLFLLIGVMTLIAVPIANMTRVWIVNLLGTGRVPIWGGCSVSDWCFGSFETYNSAPAMTTLFGTGVAGFLIVMVLFILHARFVWWPIHPVGFLLATAISPMWMREWDAFMGAWIFKTITLRIGGSKAYSNYGVPIAAGIIGGIVLASFVAYLIGIVKFFVPF
jgi:hypothetical protein